MPKVFKSKAKTPSQARDEIVGYIKNRQDTLATKLRQTEKKKHMKELTVQIMFCQSMIDDLTILEFT